MGGNQSNLSSKTSQNICSLVRRMSQLKDLESSLSSNNSSNTSSEISSLTIRRISNQLKDLQSNPLPNCNVFQSGSNWNKWEVYLKVGITSPFHSSDIHLTINFPTSYPRQPPTFFLNQGHLFFHPNIKNGSVCERTMNQKDPKTRIRDRIQGFIELLSVPNPKSFLNENAANLYQKDERMYFKKAVRIFHKVEKM